MTETFYFHTDDLSAGYSGVPVVSDVNIGLQKGEVLTLIGPNGAGKTTILKNIIRQLEPIAGTIVINGRDIAALSGNELAKEMSVLLTERLKTEMMTCEEVVETGRYPYTGRLGILSEEDKRIVKESMEQVHAGSLAGSDFRKISDGQRQRVMLARAIAQEPEIIVLDEPTTFLDIRYQVELLSLLRKLCRTRGLSVIMSLHELDLAERVSDRVACVNDGRIVRFGTPDEIFHSGFVEKLFGLDEGSLNEQTISPELARIEGEPRVFVLAGDGKGTPVFRRLQREGIPFATGILWENDLDYPVAKALAAKVVSVGAFSAPDDDAIARAKELVESCGQVICACEPEEFGPYKDIMYDLVKGCDLSFSSYNLDDNSLLCSYNEEDG